MEQLAPADDTRRFEEDPESSAAIRESAHLVACDRPPSGTATTVWLRGARISATDGPYAETKEQLGDCGSFSRLAGTIRRSSGQMAANEEDSRCHIA
jgi:hypothetical protein